MDNELVLQLHVTAEQRQVSIRLHDTATVDLLDAEMTTILATLMDASDHGVVPVIHIDSLTAVHMLKTITCQTTAHNIARVVASFEKEPIVN